MVSNAQPQPHFSNVSRLVVPFGNETAQETTMKSKLGIGNVTMPVK